MAAGFEGLYKSLQKIQSSLLLNSDGRKLKEKWLAKSNNFVQVLIYHSLNILLKSFPNIFRNCRQFQNPFSRLKWLFCLCNSFTCLHNGCCRQFSTDFTLFLTKLSPNNLLKITVVIVIIAERQADTKTKKQFKVQISYTFPSLPPQSASPLFSSLIRRLQYWKVCKLQIPVHSCLLFLLATFIFWQLHNFSAFTYFANT